MAALSVHVSIAAAGASNLSDESSAESIVAEMETVGGHLKVTRRIVDSELPLQTIYLNGVRVYQRNIWDLLLESKLRIGTVDVIPINFLSGANTECMDTYGIFGVRLDKTTYWIAKDLSYCDATFAVVGDKLVMTDMTNEGRRSKTVKTLISLDGTVSHAR